MGDHHGAAGKLEQRFFQGAQGFHVQVVGGLVQHQHVATLGQGLGQVQSAALTAGEVAHQLLLVVALEVEAADVGTAGHDELPHHDVVQATRDVFPDRLVVGQVLAALVHKRQLGCLADQHLAAVGLLHALDHAEQRGLAGAVRADDAHDGPRRHLEVHVVQQHAPAEALAHALELDHLVAQALGHGNEDLVGLVAALVVDVGQLLETGQTRLALGLAALGVGAHPLELFLHGPHAGVFLLLLTFQALLFLVQPVGIVALPGNAGAAVQFQDPLGRVVEEVAVVGDCHHRAREALQEVFQPLHALGVQVVGGLVQQQHVGPGQQQAAQRHAALLTARQVADGGLPRRQAQRVGGHLELQVSVLAASCGNDGFQLGLLRGQLVKVRIRLGVLGVHLVQPLLGREHAADALLHRLAHRQRRIHLRLLRQVADVQAGHGHGLALDVLVQARHDLQQRGLARAVQAQHTDLRAREEGQRDVLQDLPLRRHDLADAVHRKHILGHDVFSSVSSESEKLSLLGERSARRFHR